MPRMCCSAADSQLDFALRDSHLTGAVAHVLVEYFNKMQTQVGCSCCLVCVNARLPAAGLPLLMQNSCLYRRTELCFLKQATNY